MAHVREILCSGNGSVTWKTEVSGQFTVWRGQKGGD